MKFICFILAVSFTLGEGLECYTKTPEAHTIPNRDRKICDPSENVCYAQFREEFRGRSIWSQGCKKKFTEFDIGKCKDGLSIESGNHGGFHDGGSVVTTCQCDSNLCNAASKMVATSLVASLVSVLIVGAIFNN